MISKLLFVGIAMFQMKIVDMPIRVKKQIRDTTRNYIVIHNDGSNMNARSTFNVLKRRRLAYHYFINREGTIYKFVDPKYIAAHAGLSFHNGMFSWNKFSIGVCLQGKDGIPYTDAQYTNLQKLIDTLVKRYTNIPSFGIRYHSQIAFPWGRKNDPGDLFDSTRIGFNRANKIAMQ